MISFPIRAFGRAAVAPALLVAAVTVSSSSRAQTWVPNETLASSQIDLIDYEFSQSRGLLAWNDCCGSLWLASVDKKTGKFVPADGKGMLLDPDSMTFQDAQKTKNGPEWVSTLTGDTLVSTKFSGRHTQGNARIGLTAPMTPTSVCSYISADGYWCTNNLGPDTTRMAPYGSKVDGDTKPRISYVDNKGVHYWREVANPASEQVIPDFPPSNYPVRSTSCSSPNVPGARSVVYPVVIDGTAQAVYRDFDTGVSTQLTSDAGTKYEVWMWCPPEYPGELLFFTLVDQIELRVYRNLMGADGTKKWTPIFSQFAPTGNQIFSPEPFVYNGASYIFMAQSVKPNIFRSEAWIANIDAAKPIFKRITPTLPLVTRTDPEVFITDKGPMIYYNVLEPGVNGRGQPKPCREPSCSLGVWFSDPGL